MSTTNMNTRNGSILPSSERLNVALTVLRVVVGVTFIAHGVQKLFLFGLDGVAQGMAQAGVPLAAVTAPAVSFVELLAGAAIVAGLLTRLAAAGLGVIMVGAILFVHFTAGFYLPNGYEFALVLLATLVTLILTGPGAYSIDARFAARGTGREGERSHIRHAERSAT